MTLDQVMAAAVKHAGAAVRCFAHVDNSTIDAVSESEVALRAAIEAYGAAQRERCAAMCEAQQGSIDVQAISRGCAVAIRALRGNE